MINYKSTLFFYIKLNPHPIIVLAARLYYYTEKKQKSFGTLFSNAFNNASLGEYNLAIDALNKCGKLQPKNMDYLELTGICYYQLQKFEQAKTFFEEGISINPNYDRLHMLLADYLQSLGDKNDYHKLIELYQRLQKAEPNVDEYKLLLAYQQYLNKDFKTAIESFQKINDKSEFYLKSLWGIASCFYEMDEYDKGIETLKIAPINKKVLNDDLKEIHYGLGNLYAMKGEIHAAIKQFERIEIQDYNFKDIQEKIEYLKMNS